MALSKYIKMAVVVLCAVSVLVASGVQAVNVNEEEASKEMVMTATNSLHAVQSGITEIVTETMPEETTEIKETEISEPEPEYILYFTEEDVSDLAKLMLRECGGVESKTEQACVAWCVLNRVDEYGSSIHDVLREPTQFAFSESTEVRDDLYELANDVLSRWNDEKNGISNSGRVLPQEYTYFHGDGVHNYFRNAFSGNYDTWDYSLESPYDN
ncbi:MAG: cell wall hydrolase [Eubacteriales bacterium]|nr:cell wall hydrolase [Eubacteriales bacterium]